MTDNEDSWLKNVFWGILTEVGFSLSLFLIAFFITLITELLSLAL